MVDGLEVGFMSGRCGCGLSSRWLMAYYGFVDYLSRAQNAIVLHDQTS